MEREYVPQELRLCVCVCVCVCVKGVGGVKLGQIQRVCGLGEWEDVVLLPGGRDMEERVSS